MATNPKSNPGTLRLNDKGPDVKRLQQRLLDSGFDPGTIDGIFGNGTQAAVMAFQRSENLLADGVVGARTRGMLFRGKPGALDDITGRLGTIEVSRMFPHTPIGNIERNLPPVYRALKSAKMADRLMVLMALATIRAETESFQPIPEGLSRYNTSPRGHPFDLYDNRKDLGNQGPPDGERFRGRGYVQLTGRFNYRKYGDQIGKNLISKPDLACDPDIASTLLAAFLHDRERQIKEALIEENYALARRLVNGGSHGLDRFTEAYKTGIQLTA